MSIRWCSIGWLRHRDAVRLLQAAQPVLQAVAQAGSSPHRCVCDVTDALDAGQSLLSFHLRTLRDAGLVADRRVLRLNGSYSCDMR